MPERLIPMAARAADTLPRDSRKWSFEVKWDGVRAIAYVQPGRLRLESRNLNEITAAYPEVRGLVAALGMHEAVLDGEIVAFDDAGRPSFERLQRRMHVTAPNAVRRLMASTPVVYAMFDLLYLDGHSLIDLPYTERRARLESLELSGPAWRVPAAHPGDGARLLEATRSQGLEGVVAKRLDTRYEPGRRSGAWLKIKNTLRQEMVIGGWIPGEGRRTARIGALLMGVHENGAFRYAGRVGTGFTEKTLDDLRRRLGPLKRETSPFDVAPKLPREAVFVEPRLVAEVEFREWTQERVMRAPSFKGLRDDKPASEVVLESRAESGAEPRARRRSELSRGAVRRGRATARGRAVGEHRRPPAEDHELGQGPVPRDRLHQGRSDRLLRAGGAIRAPAPARPSVDAQAVSERRRRGLLLREAVALAPARLDPDRPHQRRQLHARAGPADADLAREPGRHRAAHLAGAGGESRAPDDDGVRPRPRNAGGDRGMLRGRARAARPVRSARARQRREDVGVEGLAGVRAAEHADRLPRDQAVRAARGRGARAAHARAGRLADDQAAAAREGARRLEPERRAQDDRHRVLAPRSRAADGVDARDLGGGAGMPRARRRAAAHVRGRTSCSSAPRTRETCSRRRSASSNLCPRSAEYGGTVR